MVRLAVILQRDSPGVREERLGRILTFFGVPWIVPKPCQSVGDRDSSPCVIANTPSSVPAIRWRRRC